MPFILIMGNSKNFTVLTNRCSIKKLFFIAEVVNEVPQLAMWRREMGTQSLWFLPILSYEVII
jgi:hypothetical protein